jgi:heavy-metal-associated domain-containing protein
MRTIAAAAILAIAASGLATAGEEETVAVKVYVKGMTCPQGCGAKVAAGLKGLEGAKEVKLTDFDAGLFTVSFDAKASVKPSVVQKALGSFEVTKIEATITGTVAKVEKALILTTATGTKYTLVNGKVDACCDVKPEAAKKVEEPKKAETAKKDEACDGCDVKSVVAKIEGLIKENKTSIKVTGVVSECCQGSLTVALASAAPVEAKKATN